MGRVLTGKFHDGSPDELAANSPMWRRRKWLKLGICFCFVTLNNCEWIQFLYMAPLEPFFPFTFTRIWDFG